MEHIYETQQKISQITDKYKCAHKHSEIRKKTLRNNTTQYVHQCLRCGRTVSKAIARKTLEVQHGPDYASKFKDYDRVLETEWDEGYKREKSQALGAHHETRKAELADFWQWYGEYLKSPAWKAKRQKVLDRAKGVCEGCGDNPATEVHHLTYKNKTREFLFELVALCTDCHDRVHSDHLNKSMAEIERL